MASALLPLLLLVVGAGALTSGCNSTEEAVNAEGRLVSPEERARLCRFDVPQEEDARVREEFLKMLDGKRHLRISSSHERIFDFDLGNQRLKLWDNDGIFKNYESIDGRRICLSKILDRRDQYDGFRLLEIAAANNEGVGAIAIRPTANDGIQVTDRAYDREAQKLRRLPSVEKFFYGEKPSGVGLWDYSK